MSTVQRQPFFLGFNVLSEFPCLSNDSMGPKSLFKENNQAQNGDMVSVQ